MYQFSFLNKDDQEVPVPTTVAATHSKEGHHKRDEELKPVQPEKKTTPSTVIRAQVPSSAAVPGASTKGLEQRRVSAPTAAPPPPLPPSGATAETAPTTTTTTTNSRHATSTTNRKRQGSTSRRQSRSSNPLRENRPNRHSQHPSQQAQHHPERDRTHKKKRTHAAGDAGAPKPRKVRQREQEETDSTDEYSSEEDSDDDLPPSEYSENQSSPRDSYAYDNGFEGLPADVPEDEMKENPHRAPWRRRHLHDPFDHKHFIYRKGQFTFGLLDCFSCRERGCGTACEACRCYYCHIARQCNYCINDSVEDDFFCKCYTGWIFAADCFLCCTLATCGGCLWGPASVCVLANVRYKTRERYGIDGSCERDCLTALLCAPCVVGQQYGELYAHGIVPQLSTRSRCCCCTNPYPLPQRRRIQ